MKQVIKLASYEIEAIFKREFNYNMPLCYSVDRVIQVLNLPEKEAAELRAVCDQMDALIWYEAEIIPFTKSPDTEPPPGAA